jgi:hypothetical protein
MKTSKYKQMFGKSLPLKSQTISYKKELLNVMRGEFFGEENVLEFNHHKKLYRTFSAIVISPKASIYVCPIEVHQFFVSHI